MRPLLAKPPSPGRLLAGTAANAAVEFALALPVITLLMLGSVELARYVILNQKLDRVAVSMADLVARAETISQTELDDIFIAAGEVALPFELGPNGRVIVSAVTNPDGDGPEIAWQRSNDGAYAATSRLGSEGGAATLGDDLQVREGETAIVSEVFFDFEPFLSELVLAPREMYKRAFHRPRLGTLDSIDAG